MTTLVRRIIFVAGFALWCFPLNSTADTLVQVQITTDDAPSLAWELERAGFDVLWGSVQPPSLQLIVSKDELSLLAGKGYEIEVLAHGQPYLTIQAAKRPAVGYPTLAEVIAMMSATAAAYPSICQFVDLTDTYGVAPTFEGRHLYAVKISDNVTEDEDEPAFLMMSTIHSYEVVSPVLSLDAMDRFTSQYGADEIITGLVDTYEIWIAPVWNPDGYEYVFNVDNMWRKNRRIFAGGVGVDLNRNFDLGWSSPCAGSTDPNSAKYKGPSPDSEAETQAMIAFSDDRRFTIVLEYHSFGRQVLWGYGCLNHPFASFLQSEAMALSNAAGYYGDERPPSADGEHFEWQLGIMSAHAFLMETHTEFQPSYDSAQAEAALVWPGTIWLLNRPISISGHVTDACTGDPLVATISFEEVTFENGETNTSGGPHGQYHAVLPPGDYTLQFSAAGGYQPEIRFVTVTLDSAQLLDVELSPQDGSECDDGNDCTTLDACLAGICTGTALADGTACDDGAQCTVGDQCISGTCIGTPVADGSSCDDGAPCTTNDSCIGGVCTGAHVSDGTGCDDGNACTGGDVCLGGECVSGTPISCDDDELCTVDFCDAALGCQNDPIADVTLCEDDDLCNGNETCQAGTCTAGTSLDCDDGDPCTTDSCDPAQGCQNVGTCPDGGCSCSLSTRSADASSPGCFLLFVGLAVLAMRRRRQ